MMMVKVMTLIDDNIMMIPTTLKNFNAFDGSTTRLDAITADITITIKTLITNIKLQLRKQ